MDLQLAGVEGVLKNLLWSRRLVRTQPQEPDERLLQPGPAQTKAATGVQVMMTLVVTLALVVILALVMTLTLVVTLAMRAWETRQAQKVLPGKRTLEPTEAGLGKVRGRSGTVRRLSRFGIIPGRSMRLSYDMRFGKRSWDMHLSIWLQHQEP